MNGLLGRLAVIAIGGNSLIADSRHPEVEYQWAAVRETAEHIAALIAAGWQVVITHGNGPQVGFILRRNELAESEVHPTPMDLIGADTQGAIGYMLQQALDNSLHGRGLNKSVVTLVTQTLVDANDPGFDHPTKPIGSFMTEEQAGVYQAAGWGVIEDSGRGWRRVVASPLPLDIIEIAPIQSLLREGYVVVACGGGGIPVIRNDKGELRSMNAVIDKDLASSLLASRIGADVFIISTGVPKVATNFNTPQQKNLDTMTLAEARQYLQEGHFATGSMKPKVEAVIAFLEAGGPQAIITDPPNLSNAINHGAGTWVTPR